MSNIIEIEEAKTQKILEGTGTERYKTSALRKSLFFRKERVLSLLGKLDYDNGSSINETKEELLERLNYLNTELSRFVSKKLAKKQIEVINMNTIKDISSPKNEALSENETEIDGSTGEKKKSIKKRVPISQRVANKNRESREDLREVIPVL